MTYQNHSVYNRKDVVQRYARPSVLYDAEERLLVNSFRLSEVRLLDLGVGAGRTTGPLYRRVRQYVGVDYSQAMVERAMERYPEATFARQDASKLWAFPSRSFDVVLFSFNGIDYMNHSRRVLALREIYRVLDFGGAFIFSSHNYHYARRGLLPWQGRTLDELNRELVSRSWNALRHTPRRWRMRELEEQGIGYALVNDDAHDYSLFTYYVGARQQEQQLRSAGFAHIEVFDQHGELDRGPYPDRTSVWKYYRCWKGVTR